MTTTPVHTPRPGILERLTQILDVFSHQEQHLLLDDITAATGLPRSTAFRLLTQMVELDWLQHGGVGYRLGPRAKRIGTDDKNHSTLRGAAAEVLNALHLRTGGVAHLVVLDGRFAHYLDKVGGAAHGSVPSAVGARLAASSMPCGQVLLASLSAEHVDQLLAPTTSPEELLRVHRTLNRIRSRHGVAFRPPEACRMGIGTVAAPILGPTGAVAAISVAVRNGPQVEQLGPVVAAAARQISQTVFPSWATPRRTR